MGEARHSFTWPPRTHERACMEVAQQTMTTPQAHPQEPQWDTGYGGSYSGHHESGSYYLSHGYPESKPPPSPGTLTGTLLWSSTLVMGLTRLSVRWKGSDDSSIRWMTLHTHRQRCKPPSTHRPVWCTTSSVTSGLTLMPKSCKDLSLGEVTGAQVWVLPCLILFPVFPVILSLVSLAVPLLSSWVLVWIVSIS
jgi:hypothetical protein